MNTVTSWSPYLELERFQDRVLRAMRVSQTNTDRTTARPVQSDWSPPVDIVEDEKAYVITADLPQIAKEDVKVVVENDSLVIKGERLRPEQQENRKVRLTERSYGSFQRSFSLPENLDGNGVTAAFKDGVLIVTLPKSEERKPKQIEVSVN